MQTPGDNDSLKIVPQGPTGSRKIKLLVGETPVATTSRDVVGALGLEDGQAASVDEIRSRVQAEEPTWIKQRALYLLGYRERSHAELTRRLHDDGYDSEATEDVLERLEELGLLDDARFAASYVKTKLTAGWGRRRIADGLRTAGLLPDAIESILAAEYPDDDRDRAAKLVDSRPITSRNQAARAIARLVRRGFSYATAREVVFKALESGTEDTPYDSSS